MGKTIGDICNIVTGKLDANQAVKDGQYPFFTCAEFPESIDRYAFDDDVVLVAGNNARGNFHVSRYNGKFNAYQRTYVLTTKHGYDIDYIYYALKLELKRLREKAQGSQTKFLTMPILTSIPLGNLDETEYTRVSSVLKCLDQKIDLNNRINAELEAMAKTLYDYWFVQFDFPDANGKPYKTSGGKMMYNATLKREIPAGWNDCTLSELIKLEYGKPLKSENRTGSGYPVFGSSGIVGFHDDYLVEGPGIIIGRKGTVGKVNFAFDNFYPIDTAYYVSPKNRISMIFLNYLISSLGLEGMNSDSAVPGLNRETALGISIVSAPLELISRYHEYVETWFGKKKLIVEESNILSNLRDWLLPLLMNGQVTVK
ncbi:restriction endonuclease subunit S [Citrobacter freundii]|uniref:restriction endonuclease subunit S n=1 Tax=Citrobacter freundii TaxID=546 RepID=UPI001A1ED007|nr:restriction endonuclease subunit S [Citrobacter freundii]HAU4285829.1 restriction endonuclease subunit S [Citrobacter freundii]